MTYDLGRLGERQFENLCRALAVHVLGPGVQAFGDGADGGREAVYQGSVAYPGTVPGQGWDGYIVVQAKYRRQSVGTKDADWLYQQLAGELKAWSDPRKSRVQHGRRPEYLIIATNVRLTSVAGRGGLDRITTLLDEYCDVSGLMGRGLWDANQLSMYLDAYPAVAQRFAEFITAGDVLSATFKMAEGMRSGSTGTTYRVGQGSPGVSRAFAVAYRKAGGTEALGEPIGEVYEDGPGWVQHFEDQTGRSAVICAVPERRAVAVDAALWDALCAAGAGLGGLEVTGYPEVTDKTASVIRVDAAHLDVDGGRWGRGRLVQHSDGAWRWQARYTWVSPRERDKWSAGTKRMDLRLRCAVRFQWADPVAINGSGHRRLRAALAAPECPLGWPVSQIAWRLRVPCPELAWEATPVDEGYNDRRFASYRQRLLAPDGRIAVGAWARLQTPDGLHSETLSLVDIRIDFDALRTLAKQETEGPDDRKTRLDSNDLYEIFTWCLTGGMRVLPLALAEASRLRPGGPTVVELHLDSERPPHQGLDRVVGLLDVLDLDFGEPPSDPRPSMSAALTTPSELDEDQVNDVIGNILHYMASCYGFIGGDDHIDYYV